MRICALIKYPPIQGGVSSRSFWLARGLADLGHAVTVVTHANLVEDQSRIELLEDDLGWLEYDAQNGGRVRLVQPERHSRRYTHIPQGPTFTERLASLAAQAVRQHDCELIFSYYFQPYGVVAHMVSQWTGVPYAVMHAGSDLGRLMIQPDLHLTYREIVKRADAVLSTSPRCFMAMGVKADAIYSPQKFTLPTEHFSPETEPLDVRAHLAAVTQRRKGVEDIGPDPACYDPNLPTVGIYGKLGEAKGSYDLLHALATVRENGVKFNFLAMTQGRGLTRYRELVARLGLRECTWVMPFIPHHKVPAFIRACTTVTFLERDFPIVFHTPTIATEILACGACLVVSREIADKQSYSDALRHGENVLIVEDPKDHGELAQVLRDVLIAPSRAQTIAEAGRRIGLDLQPLRTYAAGFARVFEDVLQRRRGEPNAIPAAERHVPADRAAMLKDFNPTLWVANGKATMDPARAAYLDAFPEPLATPQRDCLRFCAYLREYPVMPLPPGWADTLRAAEAVAWMGVLDDEDLLAGPFERPASTAVVDQRWADAYPLRTRWVRVETFTSLPASLTWAQHGCSPERPVVLAFHKQANLRGNVFTINPQSRHLLELCDGTRPTRAIAELLAERTGNPPEAVLEALERTLMWWTTRGLITFVDAPR